MDEVLMDNEDEDEKIDEVDDTDLRSDDANEPNSVAELPEASILPGSTVG